MATPYQMSHLLDEGEECIRVLGENEIVPDDEVFEPFGSFFIRITGKSDRKFIQYKDLPKYMKRIIDVNPYLAFYQYLDILVQKKSISLNTLPDKNLHNSEKSLEHNILLHRFPNYIPNGIYDVKKRLSSIKHVPFVLQYVVTYYILCYFVASDLPNPGEFYNLSNDKKQPYITAYIDKDPEPFTGFFWDIELGRYQNSSPNIPLISAVFAPTVSTFELLFTKTKAKPSDLKSFFMTDKKVGGSRIQTRSYKKHSRRTRKH